MDFASRFPVTADMMVVRLFFHLITYMTPDKRNADAGKNCIGLSLSLHNVVSWRRGPLRVTQVCRSSHDSRVRGEETNENPKKSASSPARCSIVDFLADRYAEPM